MEHLTGTFDGNIRREHSMEHSTGTFVGTFDGKFDGTFDGTFVNTSSILRAPTAATGCLPVPKHTTATELKQSQLCGP